jgi:hypothetical protein
MATIRVPKVIALNSLFLFLPFSFLIASITGITSQTVPSSIIINIGVDEISIISIFHILHFSFSPTITTSSKQ